jgi:hypothetical protein
MCTDRKQSEKKKKEKNYNPCKSSIEGRNWYDKYQTDKRIHTRIHVNIFNYLQNTSKDEENKAE